MNISFYKDASKFTDISSYASCIQQLPNNVEDLCKFVQNNLIHAYWIEKYGCYIEESVRLTEMQTRYAKDILELATLKSQNTLSESRSPDKKVVSICRDFSLMLCSVMRARGIPSRVRCGFATYLTPNHYEDHWVCEYWDTNESRWIMVDAQLDEIHREILNFGFNPYDVPTTKFLYAGKAWELCRLNQESPEKFGILGLNGLPFIKGNLIRDIYALNKTELLGWDTGWGILQEYMSPIESNEEMILLDQLAAVSSSSDSLAAKAVIETKKEIQFPLYWDLSQAPSITELYAKLL